MTPIMDCEWVNLIYRDEGSHKLSDQLGRPPISPYYELYSKLLQGGYIREPTGFLLWGLLRGILRV